MRGFNRIMLIGNLTKDPESRYTQSGKLVVSATLAVNEKWGEKETVTFVTLTFWEKLGEIVEKYLRKGSAVFVEGSLRITKSGEGSDAKWWASVNVTSMTMLGGPTPKKEEPEATPATEDLPF